MTAVFKLERNGQVLLEKPIGATGLSNKVFLGAFKRIATDGNTIIIKGAKDVDELPNFRIRTLNGNNFYRQIVFVIYFKGYKTSPDRKLKAIVRVDFQMEICLVYADFYTRDGAFVRSELFCDREPSNAFDELYALRNALWEKDQFILQLKDGRTYNAMMPINNVI